MYEYRLELDEPVHGAHVEELRRRVFFLSESITDFRLVRGANGSEDAVVAVSIVTDRPAHPEDLARKLSFVVANDIRPQLRNSPKVLWRSASARSARPNTFAALRAAGVLYEVGPGQVALGQPALDALEALDRLVRDLVVSEFGAREYRYPTLLPIEALHRSGYLASFPHHLMFAARLHGDVDTYRAFVADAREHDDLGGRILDRCAAVDRCLPPTMCYHTFLQLAGTTVPDGGTVVTARGASFRYEARYHGTLERLDDFTIREIVFLGPAAFVREARDRFRARAIALMEELDLAGRCEVANDPFFANADGAARISSQRLLELKHELHLHVPGGSIAAASFNLHDRHFGEAFDIRGPDREVVHTACVGFGLERLTYALLCQYGWDTAAWPAAIRDQCTSRTTTRELG